jgi:hypothetical protein
MSRLGVPARATGWLPTMNAGDRTGRLSRTGIYPVLVLVGQSGSQLTSNSGRVTHDPD